ncbi:MAG: hypothetical protein JXO48_12250 [Deltaproteobacteria bacterium]|nr:hypothetical protein [Deltaproteobacteria bacterium]
MIIIKDRGMKRRRHRIPDASYIIILPLLLFLFVMTIPSVSIASDGCITCHTSEEGLKGLTGVQTDGSAGTGCRSADDDREG